MKDSREIMGEWVLDVIELAHARERDTGHRPQVVVVPDALLGDAPGAEIAGIVIVPQRSVATLHPRIAMEHVAGTMSPNPNGCGCWTCNPNAAWFVVCGTCGNKRCPKANDHAHECTGSNEPGQKGSAYE